jgi:hypothetical protein
MAVSNNNNNKDEYDSDSDDKEFEQKLGSAVAKGLDGDDSDDKDEADLPEDGPQKPAELLAKREKKPQLFVDRPLLGMDYGSDSEDDEEEEEGEEEGTETAVDEAKKGFNY